MAIKSAGTFLRISEIASEFNDPVPNQMSEFYRGGGKVNDVATNNSVPSKKTDTSGHRRSVRRRTLFTIRRTVCV